MANDVLLQMSHISKEFPGVKALDDVSLTVKEEQYTHLWVKTVPENQH